MDCEFFQNCNILQDAVNKQFVLIFEEQTFLKQDFENRIILRKLI